MLVAFIGTHIPLLTLLAFAINATTLPQDIKTRILLVALIATLAGTGATLFFLKKLLLPVTLTFLGLRHYLESGEIPALPTEYSDEAGLLMADTFLTITRLDGMIHRLRNFDPVTNLPNRAFLEATLEQAFQAAPQHQPGFAIVTLDIDDFSAINNSLGAEAGDRLLSLAADRLRLTVPETDTLSRIGSDEFAVLQIRNDTSLNKVYDQSQRMAQAFAQPFSINGEDIRMSASVGIAFHPARSSECPLAAEQVLRNADTALRAAKEQGRNGLRFFASDMNDALRQRLELERDLHQALALGQLRVFYQPQIDQKLGVMTGVEALLRWEHPTRGWVYPSEFIPVAESSGLILPIGEWVLRTACEDNLRWQAAGYPAICVAVNVSPRQFQADLAKLVRDVLTQTKLAPERLELEITESCLMEHAEDSKTILDDLKALGVCISLDDFGTGYSSLSYLKRFPLDRLKIDQSFVRGIPSDAYDTALTQSVIALARSLDIEAIAEGVETEDQAHMLQQMGCPDMQGFFFAKPMPTADLPKFWQSFGQIK